MSTHIPIALQLYSVREEAARDLAGTLAKVAKMGYAGVEFAGFFDHPARDVRHMLDDHNLRCAGAHVGLDMLIGDELQGTLDYHHAIGNHFLIVPWLDEKIRQGVLGWTVLAYAFNDLSRRLEANGFSTGYHNHSYEFKPLADSPKFPWDLFFGQTDRSVIMQFDTGNALEAGARAEEFLARYPGRARSVHLKEYAKDIKDALLGDGQVDWTTIFHLCETIGGTQWYIVEQESYAYPPLECVERCLKNLRAMGK